jgi:hypothetical protein
MLQSDAASALISTISESANTTRNSFVYSETDNIVPYQSVQWDNITASSGKPVSGSTMHFDLNKMGIITRMVLGLEFTAADASNTCTVVGNPFINCIEHITLTSAGRTISYLNRASILARMAEQPDFIQKGFIDSCRMDAAPQDLVTTPTKNLVYRFYLPIAGFWDIAKYSLQSNFLQPLRVSLKFGVIDDVIISTTGALSITESGKTGPHLYVQYRNLSDPQDQSLIQANYSDGLLSQVIQNMSNENPVSKTLVAENGDNEFVIPLKDTSCVETIFIMLSISPSNKSSGSNGQSIGVPLQLSGNIEFRSNGTSYFDIPADMLMFWGVQSQEGRKGWGSTNWGTNADGNLKYIYCLDMSQGGLDSNVISNLLSLRELANPQIIIHHTSTSATENCLATAEISYIRRELATTVSNTGRYAISLSN